MFVLPNERVNPEATSFITECLEVLQKPSKETMYAKGAVLQSSSDSGCVYTDSAFYFSADITKKLLHFFAQEGGISCEIDAYGDFLQALGSRSTLAYIHNTGNVSNTEEILLQTREKIFKLLHGEPLYVVALNKSSFYHLGTMQEYLFHFCKNAELAKQLGLSKFTFSHMQECHYPVKSAVETCDSTAVKRLKVHDLRDIEMQGCVLHSILASKSSVSQTSVVEYCWFEVPVHVADNSIISNCRYICSSDTTITAYSIPADTFLHTVPVNWQDSIFFTTIVLHVEDDVKKSVASVTELVKLQYFGKSLSSFFSPEKQKQSLAADYSTGSLEQLFDAGSTKYSLWNAKLFPLRASMSESFSCTLSFLHCISRGHYCVKKAAVCFSLADITKAKNIESLIKYRTGLHDKIESFYNRS